MTRTLPEALGAAARGRAGYWFVRDGGDRFTPFAEVLAAACALGGALRARGLRRGERVALVLVDPEALLTAVLGASVAGLVPTPLAHPFHVDETGPWLDRLAPLLRAAEARAVVSTPALAARLEALRPSVPSLRAVVAWSELGDPALAEIDRPDADEPALLQFTSGSTSEPRGVLLTHRNLSANVAAIIGPAGLAFGAGETGVSWLPLFHDMGLIGQALCPIYGGIDAVFLAPSAFLKRPVEWLAAISRRRGTISFAPSFAYEMCVRRVRDAELDGLDLSSWRVAGCGAEPIAAATLEAFAAKFARVGFRATAFVPSYGLAEHTLAVSLGRGLRVDVVSGSDLTERRSVSPCAATEPDAARLVACGRPFPGHALRIVDEDGRPLGERAVGEIAVAGPSVMRGYVSASATAADAPPDGWLRTGDLGYLADGELYVCGRRKDVIIVNGRNHFPQDLEWVASQVDGVRPGRVAAFGLTTPGRRDRVVVVAEASPGVAAPGLITALRLRLLEATGLVVDDVVIVPKGTIGRTSSGKLRRAELRERYARGALVARPARGRRLARVASEVSS